MPFIPDTISKVKETKFIPDKPSGFVPDAAPKIEKPLTEIPREVLGTSAYLGMKFMNPVNVVQEGLRMGAKLAGVPQEIVTEAEKRAYQAMGRGALNFWNTRFFGLPLYGLKKMGFKFEDPETIEETIAGAVGDLGGFITGPARAGKLIGSKIPIVGKVFNLATTKIQSIIKPILRSAVTLGTAYGLMTPDEGLLAPEARLRQFGSGATTGAAFGVLAFIPSTPLRVLATSAYIGVPSTLREEPLETQIFNYGLGAYYGYKGKVKPSELLAQESKLARYIREGVDYGEVPILLDRGNKDLSLLKIEAKEFGPKPEPLKWRFNRILRRNGKAYYDPMKDIIAKESYRVEAKPVEEPSLVIPKGKKLPEIVRTIAEKRPFQEVRIPTPKAEKGYYSPPRLPERGRDYVYGVRLKDGTVLKGLPKDASHTDVMYRYKTQANKGLIKQVGIVDLRNGRMLTGDSEIAFKGRSVSGVLSKGEKIKIKEKRVKEWRKETTSRLHRQLYELEKAPEFELRTDDIRFIISQTGTSKKSLEALSNTELYNIEQTIVQSTKPPVDILKDRPPTKKGVVTGRKINVFDITLRKGYGLLQKLGFGNEYDTGLTNQFAMAEVRERQYARKYFEISNKWKSIVGLNKETSQRLFNYLDGKLHKNHLNPKELAVANQMKSYLDTSLEIYNRHRATYGEEPIKGLSNYITHIFDNSLWTTPEGKTISRQEFLDRKYPFPENLENVLTWVTPKMKKTPFMKARKGGLDYVEDVWRALDTYTHHVAQSVNDDPVRRAFAVSTFLKREMAINKRTGKRTVVDLAGMEENVRRFAQDYIGRPGWADKYVRNTIDVVNRVLPENLRIHSVVSLSNAVTTAMYGTQMSYRLKTAIRNMGQQSLIIGRTGFKPLAWAYSMIGDKPFVGPGGKKYTVHEILKDSWVLQSRPGAYAAESTAMDMNKFISTGMRPFAKADLFNVRTAYLAGFKYGMDQGKSYEGSVKMGNEVAGVTQFIYLRGNRSMLARGGGVSKAIGRPMSIFTTWPSNYVEFLVGSAEPQHRKNLLKYLATAGVITAALRAAGIRGEAYTGINSLGNLWDVFTGKLPISGIAAKPKVQAIRDLMKGMDEGLKEMLFYTYNKEED